MPDGDDTAAMVSVSARMTRVKDPPLVPQLSLPTKHAARSNNDAKQPRRWAAATSSSSGWPSASSAQRKAKFHASNKGAIVSNTNKTCLPESLAASAASTAANIGAKSMAGACCAASGATTNSANASAHCSGGPINGAHGSRRKRKAWSTACKVNACSKTSRANVLLPVPCGPHTNIDWPLPTGAKVSTARMPVGMHSANGSRSCCVGVGRFKQAMLASAASI
mmetsp:Transcript_137361/g.342567  ORF Transcript_137361/g.342567 Transcript_137361/m.342567 type:complete len:223 (-) Transcript_137361:393-1061(-)